MKPYSTPRLKSAWNLYSKPPPTVTCPLRHFSKEKLSGTAVSRPDMSSGAAARAHGDVEHYEITRYGSLIAWAKRLGRGDAV